MKKIFLAIGIILGVFIFLFIANIMFAMKDYHPMNSGKINNNLFTIKTGIVNLFIITNGNNVICIDAGMDIKKLNIELLKLNIKPEIVQAVFLTHSDVDHTAGLKIFKNAKIYLSKDEEQMINDKKARFFGFIKSSLPVKTYTLLTDGSDATIGNIKIHAISTPGHTPGSMCYLVNDSILFTGDALGLKDGKVIVSPKFFNMDEKTSKDSIKKTSQLTNISLMCTSHFGITNNFNYALKDWQK